MDQNKITIVGGGVAGLTLACLMAPLPVEITLVEKRPLPSRGTLKPSARTTALMTGSLDVLKRAGIWLDFKAQCTMLRDLTIIDDCQFPRGGDDMVVQRFKSSEINQGYFGYNVPLGELAVELATKVRTFSNIKILEGYNLPPDDELLTSADLIVGADGRNSVIREWAKIGVNKTDYNQTAITCLISHSKPHHNASVEFHRPGGPCTFVPMGNNQSAVVWVENTNDADKFIKLSKQDFINALQIRSRNMLGEVDLIVPPESWPLMTSKAETMFADKTILVAEAAHVLSPIGAQGLNLTMRDIDALAEALKNALLLGQNIGDATVLSAYAKSRETDINGRYLAVNMLNKMVNTTNPLVQRARRVGLKGLDYVTPVRDILMEQGLSPKA